MREGAFPRDLEGKFPGWLKNLGRDPEHAVYHLQSLEDIHLRSNLDREVSVTGSVSVVYGSVAVGISILALSLINFVNLQTAHGFGRAREIGLRKVVGASRRQIAIQFLSESALTSFVSALAAGLATLTLLPEFSRLVGRSITVDDVGMAEALVFAFDAEHFLINGKVFVKDQVRICVHIKHLGVRDDDLGLAIIFIVQFSWDKERKFFLSVYSDLDRLTFE